MTQICSKYFKGQSEFNCRSDASVCQISPQLTSSTEVISEKHQVLSTTFAGWKTSFVKVFTPQMIFSLWKLRDWRSGRCGQSSECVNSGPPTFGLAAAAAPAAGGRRVCVAALAGRSAALHPQSCCRGGRRGGGWRAGPFHRTGIHWDWGGDTLVVEHPEKHTHTYREQSPMMHHCLRLCCVSAGTCCSFVSWLFYFCNEMEGNLCHGEI